MRCKALVSTWNPNPHRLHPSNKAEDKSPHQLSPLGYQELLEERYFQLLLEYQLPLLEYQEFLLGWPLLFLLEYPLLPLECQQFPLQGHL